MKNNFKIIRTKNDKITAYHNERLLHSKYDPEKEARAIVEEYMKNYKDNILLIYGLGIGYHIIEFLKNTEEYKPHIYIFEFNDELVDLNENLGIISKLRNYDRLKLCLRYNKENFHLLIEKLNVVSNIFIHQPSLETLDSSFEEFKIAIENYKIGKKAIMKFYDKMQINAIENAKLNDNGIDEFIRKINGENIVLIAAGASLDNELELLKNNTNKFKIFAVGRALKSLMQYSIEPDMICEIDPDDKVSNHIDKSCNIDSTLCYLSTANNITVKNYKGPRYIFYNDRENDRVDTGKSVATAILSIAIRCNPKNIIFLGQDLGFINEYTHSIFAESEKIDLNIRYVEVTDVNGGKIKTTRGLLSFKRWIENKIRNTNIIKFYNCSAGAKIEGCENIAFSELLKKHLIE